MSDSKITANLTRRKSRRAATHPDQEKLPFEAEREAQIEPAVAAKAAEAEAKAEAAVAASAEAEAGELESFAAIRRRCERCDDPTERALFLLQQERYLPFEVAGVLERMRSVLVASKRKNAQEQYEEWVTVTLHMDMRKANSLTRVYVAINKAKDRKAIKYEQLAGVGYSALLALVPAFKEPSVQSHLPRLLDVARERTFKELVAEIQKVCPRTKPGRVADPMKPLTAALESVRKHAESPEEAVQSVIDAVNHWARGLGYRLRLSVKKTVTRKQTVKGALAQRVAEVTAKNVAYRDIAADLEDDQDDQDSVTVPPVGKVA